MAPALFLDSSESSLGEPLQAVLSLYTTHSPPPECLPVSCPELLQEYAAELTYLQGPWQL